MASYNKDLALSASGQRWRETNALIWKGLHEERGGEVGLICWIEWLGGWFGGICWRVWGSWAGRWEMGDGRWVVEVWVGMLGGGGGGKGEECRLWNWGVRVLWWGDDGGRVGLVSGMMWVRFLGRP